MTKITREKKSYVLWSIFLSFMLMLYYYGIQRTYYPDEQLLNRVMSFGMVCPAIPITFRTVRLFQMILYGIVAVLTYDMAIRDNDGHINWAATPIFLLFMAGLPINCVDYWADYDNGWTYYPMDRYLNVLLITMVTLTVLYRTKLQVKKYRIVTAIMIAVLTVCALSAHAYVYVVAITIAIVVCAAIEVNIKKDNSGKIFIYIFALLLLITLAFTIYAAIMDLEIRRKISFVLPENILDNILYLFEALSIVFGFDLSQLGIFNVTVFICGIRLLLVVFGLWCIGKNVASKSERVEFSERVMSYGILFLFMFACTTFFEDIRYPQNLLTGNQMQNVGNITCALPLLTIIICRNWTKIGDWIHIPCLKNKKYIFITGMLVYLCTITPEDWLSGMTVQDSKKEDYVLILQELDNRGLENGVMIGENASVITAMSEGEHVIVPIECDWESGTFGSKISLPKDRETTTYDFVIYSGSQIGQRWKDYYGIPDATIFSSANYEVMAYKNAISLGTIDVTSQRYRAGDLQYSGEVYANDYFTRIYNGSVQSGPAISLENGKYLLQIEERGLSCEDFSLTYDGGEKQIKYELVEQAEDRMVISFELQQAVKNLEFRICNTSDQDVDIYSYYLLGQ